MTNFSIVIPVFNEEKNIEKLIKEINLNLSEFDNFEIIIVDDGSTDKSSLIIKDFKKNFPIKLFENKKNLGQSYSIAIGIKKSRYKTIITLDGDGQNNPKDIPILIKKYFSSEDIYLIGGIRKKRRDRKIKIFSSIIANKVRSFILNDNCTDTGCSLKIFDRKTFLQFPFFDGIHRFLPALFKGYGRKTYFMDVDHRPRKYGVSKYGTMKRLFKGIRDLIKVVIILKKIKRNNA